MSEPQQKSLLDQVPEAAGHVAAAYFDLLRHPHDAWRANNQAAYAALRDAIALLTMQEPQDVQDNFERRVAALHASLSEGGRP